MDTYTNLDASMIDKAPAVYANFGSRLGAAVVDWLVLTPLLGLTTYFLMMSPNYNGIVLISLISLCYGPLMDHFAGGTLGKQALKQKVVREDGGQITLLQGFMRALPWWIGGMVGLYTNYLTFQIPGIQDADGVIAYSQAIAEYQMSEGGFILTYLPQLAWILPLLSTLVMLGNKAKQGAHDILAETYVVKVDR